MAEKLLSCGADRTLVYEALPPLVCACGLPMPDDLFLLNLIRTLLDKATLEEINGHPSKKSPLASAASLGAAKRVNLLLNNGACPNGGPEGNHGQKALRNPILSLLRGSKDEQILLTLLQKGANPNVVSADGLPALHLCIRECQNSQILAKLLLSFGANVDSRASDNSLALHEAVAFNKFDDIELLLCYGTSLDTEDIAGRTPLMIAIQNDHQEIVHRLHSAGAATIHSDSYLCDNLKGLKGTRRREPRCAPQNSQHLREMYWILRYRGLRTRPTKDFLPRHLTLRILDEARYWLKLTSSNARLEKYDEQRTSLKMPYLLSAPLQGVSQCSVREIVIITHSHDQGWSDHKQYHGTYEESYTWFEVAVRTANNEWLDIGTDDRIIYRNMHASDKARTHCVVFGKRPPAIPCHWIDQLRPGDRIGVIPMALYPGWVNHVQSVTIEIFTAGLDQT